MTNNLKTAYLEAVLCPTGWLSPLPVFVFGCQGDAAAVVQILHEPEEGEFIEEDLRDLHQEILPAVLQGSARKLTERVLEQRGDGGNIRNTFIRSDLCHLRRNTLLVSHLQDAFQLSVEKAYELLAFVVLLGERQDHAAHRC